MNKLHVNGIGRWAMLNRRTFTLGISSAAMAAMAARARALEVDDDNAIREILRRRVEVEKRSVGMAVCVVTPNRKRYVAWGRERLSDSRPVSSETVFEIGSITKVFTALLLANMVRRGEVGLDDPVSRHLPSDFKVPLRDGREITLADLATHTSGLPRWPLLSGDSRPSQAAIDAAARISLQDFKAWLANAALPQNPPAAGAWWYSNVGYALLGMALANRAGRPYEALLQTRVIDPVGLRDTTFHPTPAMGPRVAEGHDPDLKPLPPFEAGIFVAAGALRSSPRDLARFAAAILPGSRSPIARDQELLLTVRREALWLGGKQALGWEVLDAPGGTFVNKDGVTFGQTASMSFDPDRRTAVIAFSNSHPDLRNSSLSGGGVGAGDITRHLLRPQIPLGGQGGTR
jgi:D-alanyl-D-alanine-carboxypeptidase/D-alanyl-D-alanine-endopeptidase